MLVAARRDFERDDPGAELASRHRARRAAHPTGSARRCRAAADRQGPVDPDALLPSGAAAPRARRPRPRPGRRPPRPAVDRRRPAAGDRAAASCVVDAELAAGDLDAAARRATRSPHAADRSTSPTLRARSPRARARTRCGQWRPAGRDRRARVGGRRGRSGAARPGSHASLLVELARLRELAGDAAGARIDAAAAAAALGRLDVVVAADTAQLLDRLDAPRRRRRHRAEDVATLARDGKWWSAATAAPVCACQDSKGLRLPRRSDRQRRRRAPRARPRRPRRGCRPRRPRPARRSATPASCSTRRRGRRTGAGSRRCVARSTTRSRPGCSSAPRRSQDELDQLVAQLAAAFGLGGRDRRAASAAERARLNVTRAVRAAIAKLAEALPEAGAALDRTSGPGCTARTQPVDGELRWIVQS